MTGNEAVGGVADDEVDRLRAEVALLKEYGKYAAFGAGFDAAIDEAATVAHTEGCWDVARLIRSLATPQRRAQPE